MLMRLIIAHSGTVTLMVKMAHFGTAGDVEIELFGKVNKIQH